MTTTTPAKAAPVAERTVGQTRRIRIGAPIEGHATEFRLIGRGSALTEEAVQRDSSDPGELTVRRATGPDPEPDSADESPSVAGSDAVAATPVVARSADRSDELSVPASPGSGPAPDVRDLPVPVSFAPAVPRPAVRPLVGRLSVGSGGSATMPEPASQPRGTSAAGVQREARPQVEAILASLGGASAARPQADTPPIQRSESTPSPTVATWIPDAPRGPTSAEGETSNRSAARMPTAVRALADSPERSARSARTTDPVTWQAPIRRVAAAPARPSATPTAPMLTTGARLAVQAASTSMTPHRIVQTAAAEPPEAPTPSSESPPGGEAASIRLFADVPVQRSIDATWDAEPAVSLAPMVSRQADDGGGDAGGTAAGGATTPGAGSEKELDELARKLFPRLQNRFRNELLVDRERVGSLVDFGR